ncbi:MAG: hypothetical protein ACRELB_11980, partial [Polyangiaceae bacterium]
MLHDDSSGDEGARPARAPMPPRSISPVHVLALLAVAALPAIGIFEWFFCRIEVRQGHMAVLIAKTGRDPASGAVLAGPDEKGIRLQTLGEGRYFRNPLFWDWRDIKITEVPAGSVGVLTRLFGKVPTDGKILVGGGFEDSDLASLEKGILRDVLRPGRYRVNLLAYDVTIVPAVTVPAGFVGVVTDLVGDTPKVRNQYVVDTG